MDLRQPQPQKKKKNNRLRNILVVLGAIAVTSIGVNAADSLRDIASVEEVCPVGMVEISSPQGAFCMDAYEVSAGDGCTYANPIDQNQTRLNIADPTCSGIAQEGGTPWTNIARHQAETMCARRGAHLPTNEEWYAASLGTPDVRGNVARGDCNLRTESVWSAGQSESCMSGFGTYDMIGNVWEWVSGLVVDGEYDGRTLPTEGYVSAIDLAGLPIETASSSDLNFNEDYAWVDREGQRGMIRGGYFGSGTDGGQYAVNAVIPPSFTGDAVGFRCAK